MSFLFITQVRLLPRQGPHLILKKSDGLGTSLIIALPCLSLSQLLAQSAKLLLNFAQYLNSRNLSTCHATSPCVIRHPQRSKAVLAKRSLTSLNKSMLVQLSMLSTAVAITNVVTNTNSTSAPHKQDF